jgi:hypothetical protein
VCNIQGKPVSKPSSKVVEFEKDVPKPKPTIEFRNLKNQTQTYTQKTYQNLF